MRRANTAKDKPGITMTRFFITGIATLFLAIPANTAPIDPADVWVIDADTIQVYRQHPNVRLVGFIAPETRNAGCNAEAELGARATRRLRELVRAGGLDFESVRCSCPEGTQGTFVCNYVSHMRDTTDDRTRRRSDSDRRGVSCVVCLWRDKLPENA